MATVREKLNYIRELNDERLSDLISKKTNILLKSDFDKETTNEEELLLIINELHNRLNQSKKR